MFEHVGINHYRRFFHTIRDALRPDGVGLIHAIGRSHGPGVTSIYDERFCRMFEVYLATCEVTFRYAGHMVWQMQLTRSVDALPITRDYMHDAERANIGARNRRSRQDA